MSHGSRTINRGREIDCKVLLFEHIGVDNERYRHTDKYICFNEKKLLTIYCLLTGILFKVLHGNPGACATLNKEA